MFGTKIRTSIITLVAAFSFGGAAIVPTASQAQWHTYCMSGHCITHTNFKIGGVDPCVGAIGNYNKAYDSLLDAIQTKKEQADKVQPEMTQAEAQAKIEEAEGQVHLASIAAFEWGCDVAAHAAPTSVVVAPIGAVQGSPEGSTLPPVQGTLATSSPAPAL
jgi:hypothetical protein